MPQFENTSAASHMNYVGVLWVDKEDEDVLSELTDGPLETQEEIWDIWLAKNCGYLMLRFGPGPSDYLCGPREMWENLTQPKQKENSFDRPLWMFKSAYAAALRFLAYKRLNLQ